MSSLGHAVTATTDKQGAVLRAIVEERERQDVRWGTSDHWQPAEWGAILAEEYGEAAREFADLHFGYGESADIRERLRTELIQVAAMAVKIVERIDRGEI